MTTTIKEAVSPDFENHSICAECGGICCKANPGTCSPCDFGSPPDPKRIAVALESGNYQVDWDESLNAARGGWETIYFVRPTVDDKHRDKVYHGTWGGRCILLTDTGCSLPLSERPYGCRSVEPFPSDKDCIMHGGSCTSDHAVRWEKFQDEIRDAYDMIERV